MNNYLLWLGSCLFTFIVLTFFATRSLKKEFRGIREDLKEIRKMDKGWDKEIKKLKKIVERM